jgi:hypothetical protein
MSMSDVGKKWREVHFGGAVKWLISKERRGGSTQSFAGRIFVIFSGADVGRDDALSIPRPHSSFLLNIIFFCT